MLALFKRDLMAEAVGTKGLPKNAAAQDRSLVVLQVNDVNETHDRMAKLEAEFIGEPKD